MAKRQAGRQATAVMRAPKQQQAFRPGLWPVVGGGQAEYILMPGGEAGLTLQELQKACHGTLTDMMAAVTSWPDTPAEGSWCIGDSVFLIVETTVSEDVQFYVQVRSEPFEDVLCEACSGERTPAVKRLVDGEPTTRIEAMGFARGGDAGNFQKVVPVHNRGDAAAVARDILRIVHDAYRYGGETPLVVRAWRERPSRHDVVHDAFSVADTRLVLGLMGFPSAQPDDDRPIVVTEAEGQTAVIEHSLPREDTGRFECLDLYAWIGPAADFVSLDWMTAANRRSRVAVVNVDDDGDLYVRGSVSFFGGVTDRHIAMRINGWLDAVKEALAQRRRRGGGGRRRRRAVTAGHGADGARERASAPVVH